MAKRIFLHVGTPKSGTTYLQAILWQNAERLKRDGLLLPGRFKSHYVAAKGVTSRSSLKRDLHVDVETAWPRLMQQVNRWGDDAVISHELLAPATSTQADAAKSRLKQAEIHIVLTARALHKQLPAAWQEQVKSGLATPYHVFLQRVRDREAKGRWFWGVQDLPDIARRWSTGVPPHRVHIVTVPSDASDATLLWRRYARALGLDPTGYDADVPKKNVSLGPVESELLRKVHAVQDERFTDRQRHQWTRKLLASEILAKRRGDPIRLPDTSQQWLAECTSDMVASVRAAGYDVVGDLHDLGWRPPSPNARSIESVTDDELDEASDWTIARLQEELMRRESPVPPPPVGPHDGVDGILELLEHIRAADCAASPREPTARRAAGRLRKSITAFRNR